MRLLVVSHTPHHLRDGQAVGWGATVRELDHLATRFEKVRHVACLYEGAAPASELPYRATNLELVAVPPAGGDGLRAKLDVVRASTTYWRTIGQELANADLVHVRAPANIAMVAMALLVTRRTPRARWFKYAGNWQPEAREPLSYTLQRRSLESGRLGGIVTVNGEWPRQPAWVRSFFNPSLEADDLATGRAAAAPKSLEGTIRMLFVGALVATKGAKRCLEVLAKLVARGLDVRLEMIGDGVRAELEHTATALQISNRVEFLGWRPTPEVHSAYSRAHILLLPSQSEGWPKVLSEGMAFGLVPVASAVGSIPWVLSRFGVGVALPPYDVDAFAGAVQHLVDNPREWKAESERAVAAARWFSFEYYLECVDELLEDLTRQS